jgi:hypothetical protein
VPELPELPLVPDVPLDPELPDVPDDPDDPLVPDDPEEPLDPDDPDVPDVPPKEIDDLAFTRPLSSVTKIWVSVVPVVIDLIIIPLRATNSLAIQYIFFHYPKDVSFINIHPAYLIYTIIKGFTSPRKYCF